MARHKVPTEWEAEILRRNHIDPECVAVTYSDEDCIRAMCYETRDEIVIHRGDKKWS